MKLLLIGSLLLFGACDKVAKGSIEITDSSGKTTDVNVSIDGNKGNISVGDKKISYDVDKTGGKINIDGKKIQISISDDK